jgi:hypothetical protein
MSGRTWRLAGVGAVLGLFLMPGVAAEAPAQPRLLLATVDAPAANAAYEFVLCGWRFAPSQLACDMQVEDLPDVLTIFVRSGFVGTVSVTIIDQWNSWFRGTCHIEAVTNPAVGVCTSSGPGVFASSSFYRIQVRATTYSLGWYNGGVAYEL